MEWTNCNITDDFLVYLCLCPSYSLQTTKNCLIKKKRKKFKNSLIATTYCVFDFTESVEKMRSWSEFHLVPILYPTSGLSDKLKQKIRSARSKAKRFLFFKVTILSFIERIWYFSSNCKSEESKASNSLYGETSNRSVRRNSSEVPNSFPNLFK